MSADWRIARARAYSYSYSMRRLMCVDDSYYSTVCTSMSTVGLARIPTRTFTVRSVDSCGRPLDTLGGFGERINHRLRRLRDLSPMSLLAVALAALSAPAAAASSAVSGSRLPPLPLQQQRITCRSGGWRYHGPPLKFSLPQWNSALSPSPSAAEWMPWGCAPHCPHPHPPHPHPREEFI